MALQTYIVCCQPEDDLGRVRAIASFIQNLGGLILLVTSQKVLLAAFDDSRLELVRRFSGVQFVGGVTLDPRGAAGQQLFDLIQKSISLQLASSAEHRHVDSTVQDSS